MSRTNFRLFLDSLAASIRTFGKLPTSSVAHMHERGNHIHDKIKEVEKNRNYHNNIVENLDGKLYEYNDTPSMRFLSEEASSEMKQFIVDRKTTFKFNFPQFDMARQFAIKKGDKKLAKMIDRIEAYSREEFENSYKADEIALDYYVRTEELKQRIISEKEDLAFLEKYFNFSAEGLIEEIEKRNKMISSISYSNYSVQESERARKLRGEVYLLESLLKLQSKQRKKMLIAKTKEIKEIQEKGVNSKGYKNRYIKHLRKLCLAHNKALLGVTGDLAYKAKEIIGMMSRAVEFTPIHEGRVDFNKEPKVIIDPQKLEKIEQKLTEIYYSGNNSKTK